MHHIGAFESDSCLRNRHYAKQKQPNCSQIFLWLISRDQCQVEITFYCAYLPFVVRKCANFRWLLFFSGFGLFLWSLVTVSYQFIYGSIPFNCGLSLIVVVVVFFFWFELEKTMLRQKKNIAKKKTHIDSFLNGVLFTLLEFV